MQIRKPQNQTPLSAMTHMPIQGYPTIKIQLTNQILHIKPY